MKTSRNRALFWEKAGLIIILIVEILLIYNRALYGLDSVGITLPDGGYRVFSGQLPFRDFHTPLGVSLFYWQAAFFHLFGGFSMKAVALQSAMMGAVGTLMIFLILRVFLGGTASLGFACVAALTFSLPRSIPLFDEPTNTFYLVALATFSLAYKYRYKLTTVMISFLAALSGLAFTASIFSKHAIGFIALALISPLWLLVPFGNEGKLINRAKSFGICLFSTLFFTIILVLIFSSHGDFFADTFRISGQMDRLLILLPHSVLIRFLSKDFGKIFLIVNISVVVLTIGFKYLLKLNMREILKDQGGLLATIVSLTALTYLAEMMSRSAGLTSLGLFSLLLGLLYAVLSKLMDSYHNREVENRRLSNFSLITGLIAVIIFSMWGLTYGDDFPGRTIPADIFFLSAMMIIAVALLALGFFYRKTKKKSFSSTKNIFIGGKVYVVFLALSLILYFVYDAHVGRRAMARLLMPLLKNTDIVQYVEIKNVPALSGVYTDKRMAKAVEELVLWFKPKLEKEPSLRDGSGIYIFPYGMSLYGILGVESFRDAHLFLDYNYTFSQPDPDTDEIIKRSPKFILIYRDGINVDTLEDLSVDTLFGTFKDLPLPELNKILKKDYALKAKFGDFVVFQRVL